VHGSNNGHAGPTGPPSDPGRKRSAWVRFALAAAIVAASAAALEFEVRSAQPASRVVLDARSLSAATSRERALEEEALARGGVGHTLAVEQRAARDDAKALVERLQAAGGADNATVGHAVAALAAYHKALDATTAALKEHASDRAAALDRSRVGPAWTHLDLTLDTTVAAFGRTANLYSTMLMALAPAVILLVIFVAAAFVMRARGDASRQIELEAERRARDRTAAVRRELLARTVQAAEDERTRLAAELHDGPVQRLTAVDYLLQRMLGQLKRGEVDKGAEVSAKAQQTIREEIAGLRRIMADLRPPILDQRGLVEALREYARRLGATAGIACTVDSRLEERLSPASETVLYRVAQEALQNVSKHSKASAARISIRQSQGWVRLEVQDDGIGYEPSASPDDRGRHFGMLGMKERIEMVGGRWDVFSRPGQGTRIAAILPKEPAR
jgi:signal transduction histidine kinase